MIGIAVGVALALPQYQLVFAGIALSPVILALMGAERCIGILLLAAVGCVPFVNSEDVAGGLPIWLVAAGAALGLMLLTLVARVIARAPAWPAQPSVLGLAMLILLAYVLQRLAASSPLDIPSLTANIAAFAVIAPVTWFWLTHVAASEGLRRAVPMLVIIVAAWCLIWIAGSVGACGQCQAMVGSTQQASGVAGTLRLYAAGESAAGAMVLFALAWLVWRPSIWPIVLIVLGTTVVILGGSRAFYFGVGGGALVILAYTFRNAGTLARMSILAALLVVGLAVATSPVGARAGSSYQELKLGSGTGGYRLALLDQTRPSWTTLGLGSSKSTLDAGFTADLGVPNTFLALGFVGGALQFLVMGLAAIRGLRSRVPVGVAAAGVMAMVMLSRGSLPLLEYGPSATLIGVSVGLAAALMVPRVAVDD